jgi:hypothetical protein
VSIAFGAAAAEAFVIAIAVLLGCRFARVREPRGPDRLTRERRELEQLLREPHPETSRLWDLGSASAAVLISTYWESERQRRRRVRVGTRSRRVLHSWSR